MDAGSYECGVSGMVLSNIACMTHGTTLVLQGPMLHACGVLHCIERTVIT